MKHGIVYKEPKTKMYYLYDKRRKQAFLYNPWRTNIFLFTDKEIIEQRVRVYTELFKVYSEIQNSEFMKIKDDWEFGNKVYHKYRKCFTRREILDFLKQIKEKKMPRPQDIVIKEITV